MIRNMKIGKKWLRAFAWLAVIIVGVPLLLLVVLSLYLTPGRLTELANREGSRYLNADIKAEDIDYTLWSSFPRIRITTGKISVISRTLRDVSPAIRKQLPDSADFLGSIRSFSGEINVIDLFMNRYVIHDVDINGLRLNLVAYNDSINNYNILPGSASGFKKIPYFSAEKIELRNPGVMSYRSVSTDTRAS
ncbi:MAG: LemA family protein, partial [Muribaculaceae bacterium]|nr:LemA family protein [Muribaculaceae bacterium]